MHFDLIDLRLLVAVADAGSLSKAAAEFPLALSAASNRLRQLEQRCQLSLFTRHTEGMHPTPAGRIALDHARRVVAEASQLREALEGLNGSRRITVRLAANTAATNTFLPAALGPFLTDYPQVDLQLDERPSLEILQAVRSETVDIGVLDGNLPLDGVVSLPFRHDRLVLLVHADHPLASHASCVLRDALGYPFVGMPAERAMQHFVEEMAARIGKPVVMRVRAPSFFSIAQLVAQGVGVAVLPEAAAARHCAGLPIHMVRLEDPWASRELRLCIRSLDGLSAQARQLLAYLTSPLAGDSM